MRERDQARARGESPGQRVEHVLGVSQAHISEANDNAKALPQERQRHRDARMFQGGGNDFVACLPVQPPEGQIDPLGGVVRQRHTRCWRVHQRSEILAQAAF